MAVTAALSPSSFPQSSIGRFEVIMDECLGPLAKAEEQEDWSLFHPKYLPGINRRSSPCR